MSDPLPIAIGAAAVALLAVAVGWRLGAVRRARKAFTRALISPDARTRLSALQMLAGQGLRAYADVLVRGTAEERDPDVRAALATAIAQSQWEPADDARLVQLRLWARAYFAEESAADAIPASPAVAESPPTAELPPESQPVEQPVTQAVAEPAAPSAPPVPGPPGWAPPDPAKRAPDPAAAVPSAPPASPAAAEPDVVALVEAALGERVLALRVYS